MQAAQLATVQNYWKAMEAGDFEALNSIFDDNLSYQLCPASVAEAQGLTGGWSKSAFLEFAKTLPEGFKSFGIQRATELVQGEDKLVMHFKVEGVMKNDATFKNELAVFFDFVPGTTKIVKVVEFVDSDSMLSVLRGGPAA